MNLEQLIGLIQKELNASNIDNYTKTEVKEMYKALVTVINEQLLEASEEMDSKLLKYNKVNLPLIGRFKISKQDSYYGRNPNTKEKVKVSASNRIYFSPYKALKNTINNK